MDRFEQIINIRRALFKNEVPVAKGDKPVDVQEAENIKKNGNDQAQIDLADYPWDACIADQIDRGYSEESANNICGWIKANYQTNFAESQDGLAGACWPGYEAIGTKETEDGRIVPNCVPVKEEQSKEEFVIPSPEGGEDEQTYISRCISAIYDEYGQEQSAAICYAKWQEK